MTTKIPPSTDLFMRMLGERIKFFRKQRGMSLHALGEKIGCDRARIQVIERGSNPTLLTLLKIAAALEISFDVLMDVKVHVDSAQLVRFSTKKPKRSQR